MGTPHTKKDAVPAQVLRREETKHVRVWQSGVGSRNEGRLWCSDQPVGGYLYHLKEDIVFDNPADDPDNN